MANETTANKITDLDDLRDRIKGCSDDKGKVKLLLRAIEDIGGVSDRSTRLYSLAYITGYLGSVLTRYGLSDWE